MMRLLLTNNIKTKHWYFLARGSSLERPMTLFGIGVSSNTFVEFGIMGCQNYYGLSGYNIVNNWEHAKTFGNNFYTLGFHSLVYK